MQHKLVSMIVTVCSLFSLCTLAEAAPINTVIVLKGYNYEDVVSGDTARITDTLYPSGLNLPTRFMDFLDFVPYDGEALSGPIAEYLSMICPDAYGEFTYAEYKATERFLKLKSLEDAIVPEALNSAIQNLSFEENDWLQSSCGITLEDGTRFSNAMRVYRDFFLNAASRSIEDFSLDSVPGLTTKMQDAFYMTAGLNVPLYKLESGEDFELYEGVLYSDYLQGLSSYWNYFGLKRELNDNPDPLPVEDQGISEEGESDIVRQEYLTLREVNRYIYTDAHYPRPERDIQVFIEQKSPRNSASAIQVPEDLTAGLPLRKQYNLRDVVTGIAVISVVTTVIVTWIIHTIRKRQDPTRQWKN